MKRYIYFVMIVWIVCVLTGTAIAQQSGITSNKPSPASTQGTNFDYSSWSIGAGIGYSYYEIGGISSVGSIFSSSIRTPFGAILVERQFTENLCLFFNATGSYSKYDSADNDPYSGMGALGVYSGIDINASAGGAIGIRWIFNPGGVVEISGLVSIGVIWSYVEGEYYQNVENEDSEYELYYLDYDANTYSLGGGLGLAFEKKLLDNLFLRFESSFVRAYYGQEKESLEMLDGSTDTMKNSIFNAALAFTPMIQLRLLI